MRERNVQLKKEQIERFEKTKGENRRIYIEKRKRNHRSEYNTKKIKTRWEKEDAIRATKRQKKGLI